MLDHGEAKALIVGNPFDEKVQIGPIVSERQAALLGREHVDQDRRRGCRQHRTANALDHAPAYQEPARRITGWQEAQQHRGDREDQKTEVVDLGAAEHVAQPPEAHH